MFSFSDVEQENYSDEIGTLIRAIQKIPTHTQSKVKLISELKVVCKNKGYITFSGFTQNFHIGRIGQSYFYDVPLSKTGHLRKFRGKRIRVICIASGLRWMREYMVGEV